MTDIGPARSENNDWLHQQQRQQQRDRVGQVLPLGQTDVGQVHPLGPHHLTVGERERAGMRDAIEAQRLANMPQAQASGLVQASLNAQLNGLNGSPIQRRQIELQQRANDLLESIATGGNGMAR